MGIPPLGNNTNMSPIGKLPVPATLLTTHALIYRSIHYGIMLSIGNGVMQFTPKVAVNGNVTFGFNSSRAIIMIDPLSTCAPSLTNICIIHGTVPGSIAFYTSPSQSATSIGLNTGMFIPTHN
jgi:hypothetical protein